MSEDTVVDFCNVADALPRWPLGTNITKAEFISLHQPHVLRKREKEGVRAEVEKRERERKGKGGGSKYSNTEYTYIFA